MDIKGVPKQQHVDTSDGLSRLSYFGKYRMIDRYTLASCSWSKDEDVKKRPDSSDDLFQLGWCEEKTDNSGSSPTTMNCFTIYSPPDGYHRPNIMD